MLLAARSSLPHQLDRLRPFLNHGPNSSWTPSSLSIETAKKVRRVFFVPAFVYCSVERYFSDVFHFAIGLSLVSKGIKSLPDQLGALKSLEVRHTHRHPLCVF